MLYLSHAAGRHAEDLYLMRPVMRTVWLGGSHAPSRSARAASRRSSPPTRSFLLWWTTIQRLGSSGSKNMRGTPLTERWEAACSPAKLMPAFCFAFEPGTNIRPFPKTGCST